MRKLILIESNVQTISWREQGQMRFCKNSNIVNKITVRLKKYYPGKAWLKPEYFAESINWRLENLNSSRAVNLETTNVQIPILWLGLSAVYLFLHILHFLNAQQMFLWETDLFAGRLFLWLFPSRVKSISSQNFTQLKVCFSHSRTLPVF